MWKDWKVPTNLRFCFRFFLAYFFFLESLFPSFGLFISCVTSYFSFFYLWSQFMVPLNSSQVIIKCFCTAMIVRNYQKTFLEPPEEGIIEKGKTSIHQSTNEWEMHNTIPISTNHPSLRHLSLLSFIETNKIKPMRMKSIYRDWHITNYKDYIMHAFYFIGLF